MNAARRPNASEHAADGELLSSLIDGECPAGDTLSACERWRSDPQLRSTWRTYHLIGDVLRSDEPASRPAAQADFMQGLRQRLAQEPVPMSPAPLAATPAVPSARAAVRLWRVPAAAVAGLVVAGAAVVVMRPDSPATGWDQSIVATQPATNAGLHQVSRVQASASAQPLVLDGQIIRDARLDAYFEAHRGAVGPAAAAVPGGALRSVEILVPQR